MVLLLQVQAEQFLTYICTSASSLFSWIRCTTVLPTRQNVQIHHYKEASQRTNQQNERELFSFWCQTPPTVFLNKGQCNVSQGDGARVLAQTNAVHVHYVSSHVRMLFSNLHLSSFERHTGTPDKAGPRLRSDH